jgi:ATP-dependent DNA helicase DinG
VVVSTNTRNLQAQLVEKDLPRLCRAIQGEVRFAMIKGRRNYLCLRKLLYLLAHGDTELERGDLLPLASVLVWLVRTTTGDIHESMVGERPHLRDLAARLTSVAEECRGTECEQRRRCFLQRARRLALAADVVVANHAVVFSEMANPLASPVLPPHRQIVFDEAHNLEEAVTSAMSREVSQRRARAVLSRLLRAAPRRRPRGLIPSLQRQLRKARGVADSARQQVLGLAETAMAAVRAADAALAPFFGCLAALLRVRGETQPFRIHPGRERPPEWSPVEPARQRLLEGTAAAMREATALADALTHLGAPHSERLADFDRELRAAALWLGEFCHDLETVLDATEPGWVCWVEAAPPPFGGGQAWGAPIDVGPLLHQHLYSTKSTAIFTSATMTVNGSTDYLRRRLGIGRIELERLVSLALGTVFDYARQCLVLVPTFLAEPTDPRRDYAAELCGFLIALFRRTRGRALALFTSHEMLRRCAGPLRQDLSADGIRVFAQGLSGSRESLLRRLVSDPQTVLLGAHSFWEGVDVVGQNLSCVVLARLPFAVHTDPVVAARCEAIAAEGGDAFLEYSLPAAVIRFRQGFGRLIRHRRDRGVIVVADRRIVSKRYGEWFRASVPAPLQLCPDVETLLAAVAGFLGD